MIHILVQPEQRWECPNCPVTDVTKGQTNRFHRCSGLAGLITSLVPAGQRCKVEAVEREDYVGREDVRYDDNGRPISAVVTTRESGTDVLAYAPTAHLRAEVQT